MRLLHRVYGAGPLHLLTTVASLALAAYAFTRIFNGPQATNVIIWFVGAIVAHDLIAFPLYTLLDRLSAALAGVRPGMAARPPGVPVVNYVRVPAVLAGIAFVVYFPLILGLGGGRYERATTLSQDAYLGRWLLICGGLFAVSALLYAVRAGRARRGDRAQ
jgi:hypothetical protein